MRLIFFSLLEKYIYINVLRIIKEFIIAFQILCIFYFLNIITDNIMLYFLNTIKRISMTHDKIFNNFKRKIKEIKYPVETLEILRTK